MKVLYICVFVRWLGTRQPCTSFIVYIHGCHISHLSIPTKIAQWCQKIILDANPHCYGMSMNMFQCWCSSLAASGLVVVSRTLLSGKLQQLFFQPNLLLSRQQLVHRHSLILLQIQMQMPVHYIVWSSWHSGGRPSLAFFVSHMADVVPWLPSTPMVSRRMHWAVQQF